MPGQALTNPDLRTPLLLLDVAKFDANIARMNAVARDRGVQLRVHVKTCKSIELVRRAVEGWSGAIAVSTIAEAEAFAAAGFDDIHYAVALTPAKLKACAAIADAIGNFSMTVASPEAAHALAASDATLSRSLTAFIEIDVDGSRGGFPFDDRERIRDMIARMGPARSRLIGFMTHAGGAYGAPSPQARERMAQEEVARLVSAAHGVVDAPLILSVGSTPTAITNACDDAITELRIGTYMFMDRTMEKLGVCETSDIALSVLATVIGLEGDRALVDAGWTALSADGGVHLDGDFGLVCDLDGRPLTGARLRKLNQEHGIVDLAGATMAVRKMLQVGARVRILPNHACATGAQHDVYALLERGRITSTTPRMRGW